MPRKEFYFTAPADQAGEGNCIRRNRMFYYLDGTVAEILPGLAVIDCGGVGYAA